MTIVYGALLIILIFITCAGGGCLRKPPISKEGRKILNDSVGRQQLFSFMLSGETKKIITLSDGTKHEFIRGAHNFSKGNK